ncbi:MAG: hypothetical protein Q8R35_01270 [bacterium]|nr:hypothetical protein [bacterium]
MSPWFRFVRYGLYVLGGLLGAFVLWTIGQYVLVFVLMGLFIAAFIGLALFQRGMPELKWLTSMASAGLIVWILLAWLGPLVGGRLDRSWPYTAASAGRKQVEQDVRQSEAVDPIAIRGRIAMVEYCRSKEAIEEGRLRVELGGLLERRRAGLFDEADRTREAKLFARLANIAEERRICQEQLDKLTKVSRAVDADQRLRDIQGASRRTVFWILGVVIAVALIIGAFFPRFRKLVVGVVVLVAAIYLVDWLIWGGGLDTYFVNTVSGKPQPGMAIHTPFPGVQRVTVLLQPGEETPVGHLIRGGWCYAVRRGDAKNLRLKFTDGAVEPFGGRYHGWRELEALVADGGTAAIETYKPTAGSCRPEDAS